MDVRIDQATRLAQEWAGLGSIELIVAQEKELPRFLAVDGNEFRSIETHYMETPARERFMEMSMQDTAGKPNGHRIAYSDGGRYLTFEYLKDELTIPRTIGLVRSFDNEATYGSSARPDPLRYYYISKTPLHEALPSSTFLGTETLDGKSVNVFLFKNVLWGQFHQVLVLHLAEDAILPQKVISYRNEEARLRDRALWSWTATRLESIQGKIVPVRSLLVTHDPDDQGKGKSSSEIVIQQIAFGKTWPRSTFWRDIDPRATVIDNVNDKVIPPQVRPVATKAVVAAPVRVDPFMNNSHLWMVGGLTIGVVALVSGLILRFRRGS